LRGYWDIAVEGYTELGFDWERQYFAAPLATITISGGGGAQPLTVTSLADDGGSGELRTAISAANLTAGATITFKPGLSGTITLTDNLPYIQSAMTVAGPGAQVIAIDGAGRYRPFTINASSVTISGLTIRNGNSQSAPDGGGGGAIDSGYLSAGSTVTVANCTLSHNTTAGDGGAIQSVTFGTLKVTGCTFSANVAARNGGAVDSDTYGVCTMTNCTFAGNTASSGGGIYDGVDAVLVNCTIFGNTATGGSGGGLYSDNGTRLTNCILYGDVGSEVNTGPYVFATNCDVRGASAIGLGSTNIDADPLLGPLANNGGPTQTLALLAGSPCLGAGTSAGAPATDQRGVTRPNPPSIGAYD
jgi:hypothetical protein